MKTLLVLCAIVLLIVSAAYGRGTDDIDRRTIPSFDIRRYMGDWYEIARFDHRRERGLVEVRTSYSLVADDCAEVVSYGTDCKSGRCRKTRGRVKLTAVPGRLKASFLGLFSSDYNILELAEDYEWVLVGSASPDFLWILSRTPSLPVRTLNRILRLAERRGYPTRRLLYIDHGL